MFLLTFAQSVLLTLFTHPRIDYTALAASAHREPPPAVAVVALQAPGGCTGDEGIGQSWGELGGVGVVGRCMELWISCRRETPSKGCAGYKSERRRALP